MLKTVTELRFLLRATKGAKNEKRQQPNGAIRHGWITLVANDPCSKFVFFYVYDAKQTCVYFDQILVELFATGCCKTKAKLITLTNPSGCKQSLNSNKETSTSAQS